MKKAIECKLKTTGILSGLLKRTSCVNYRAEYVMNIKYRRAHA